MKVVTYNVNGLKQRVSQFDSLLKLLDSFDADIICFQETKLRRQELTSDLTIADGYESFFSCTRTCEKGRTGYSGVATFCRVKSASSSCEAALPVAAEEGFTGLVNSGFSRGGKSDSSVVAEGLEECEREELLRVDQEGRCVMTDHGHFVVFNVYGPRAVADDAERVEFKHRFYDVLERRWECLLRRGRRVFVVGDLNIAPFAMDRCEAGPDFEKNEFRKWFRSLLVERGGSFSDVFRSKHPERTDAFTCWSSSSGAEQFNYGSRIDHILVSGPCFHGGDRDQEGHSFLACHVKECDILTEYKRFKNENMPTRWKGGLGIKLKGSDHVPVFTSFDDLPDIPQHSTPPLASRYLPMIFGFQQTLASVLMKRQANEQAKSIEVSCSSLSQSSTTPGCGEISIGPLRNCSMVGISHEDSCSLEKESTKRVNTTSGGSSDGNKKKVRRIQSSQQLSLKSFFTSKSAASYASSSQSSSQVESIAEPTVSSKGDDELTTTSSQELDQSGSPAKQKNDAALMEWQRIQNLMQNSIPLCKGHKEACVARVVKKPGPTFGRRFYVCSRAEGPSSNPEANCGYFKWASSKCRDK